MGTVFICKSRRQIRGDEKEMKKLCVLSPFEWGELSSDTEIENNFDNVVSFIDNDCNMIRAKKPECNRTCCSDKNTNVVKKRTAVKKSTN